MKGCLDKLIHLLQSSFVPGRHATDDILIAQELTHSIRKSTAKNEGLMVKLDLEKAYDRVSWEFLMDTLRLFGFLERTMQLIGSVYPELLSLCCGMASVLLSFCRLEGSDKATRFRLIFSSFTWSAYLCLFNGQWVMVVGHHFQYVVMALAYLIFSLQMIYFFLSRLILNRLVWLKMLKDFVVRQGNILAWQNP